jgi:hypothetical protein
VAEIIAGEIGRAIGLPVPEIVLVDFDPALGAAEPHEEIRDLLDRSPGTNVGLDFLPGALPYAPAADAPAPGLAADVVWFDGLVMNPDRTPRNVNMLVWHRRLWLIDHGAALYIHHTWRDPAEHARRPFPQLRDHVLLPVAGSIAEADARLAPLVTPDLLRSIVDAVPDDWLAPERGLPDPASHRDAYVEYLLWRLEAPRAFVEEVERARTA